MKFTGFGDMHGPKQYKSIRFFWGLYCSRGGLHKEGDYPALDNVPHRMPSSLYAVSPASRRFCACGTLSRACWFPTLCSWFRSALIPIRAHNHKLVKRPLRLRFFVFWLGVPLRGRLTTPLLSQFFEVFKFFAWVCLRSRGPPGGPRRPR